MYGICFGWNFFVSFFFFQAEDGIRDAQESRGLGDVYKRQGQLSRDMVRAGPASSLIGSTRKREGGVTDGELRLSLIHI